MKLGEFISQFSHNNLIRLWYNTKQGHEIVGKTFDDVSMDWEVNEQKGKFRHYVNNEVLGLATICFSSYTKHVEALNIVIERLENQPIVDEAVEVQTEFCTEAM